MTTGDGFFEALGDDVMVWRQEPSDHDHPNAGVILEEDGVTVVDTLAVPSQAAALVEALEPYGLPIRRALYTTSHLEAVGGSSVFWSAARYGRPLTSAMLDRPADPSTLARLHPSLAEELVEPTTRPVSHTVDTAAWLSGRVCALPSTGQMAENLVAIVPDADVLFAGAMCCFGVTPNAFDGDPEAWAGALGEIGEMATTIVPGIGPVGGADEVLALEAYLWACVEAAGDPGAIPSGPWDDWADRHLDEVNVERAAMLARGDQGIPPSMLRLLGLGG